jgi:homopolymeric O-antigen transport system ATP-binding protein
MTVVIDVKNLGKLYRLGKVGTGTLGHDLKRWWATVRGLEDPFAKVGTVNDRTQASTADEYVWALQDINFQVTQGEVVGIIGKNGAGKSTLLKLLSRITAPSTGEVKIKGRIGSLLEVGTGFHPEMTGGENIFMNGTVLGMKRKEISRKFDDIVDFAGVAKYIDTPVKRYSSGMMVRLGFAVAAFLEPEILIVDEVLAVGDAEFQQKAIGKMKQVSRESGRTILFVSHNLRAVLQLCKRGIVLENGLLNFDNSVDKAIRYYVEGAQVEEKKSIHYFEDSHNEFQMIKACLTNGTNDLCSTFTSRDRAIFRLDFEVREKLRGARIGLQIENQDGIVVFTTTNAESMQAEVLPGIYTTTCELPVNVLNDGDYGIRLFAGIPGQMALYEPNNLFKFSHRYLESRGTLINEPWKGIIVPSIEWSTTENGYA